MSPPGEPASAPDGSGRLPAWLATFLTGLAMGSADAVPGVSGGTIALIAGIYDRLVGAIASFEPGLLVDAVEERSVRPVGDLLVAMDVWFLAALGVGVVTGIASVARIVVFGYQDLPAITYAFFFGLIAASAYVLFEEVALDRRREQLAAVAGVVLAFVFTGQFSADIGQGPVVVLLAGTVSICAMILPGVSGSFVLFVLGLHEFLAGQLNGFVDAAVGLATGGSLEALLEPGVFVVAYATGAALGLLTFARVVQAALERDRETTITFLVALMAGALRLPVREVAGAFTDARTTPGESVVLVAVAALVGIGLVVALDRYTAGIGYVDD